MCVFFITVICASCLIDSIHRRHIDRTLGAPINTFVIAAKTCISVLREEDAKEVCVCLCVSVLCVVLHKTNERGREQETGLRSGRTGGRISGSGEIG